MVQTWLSLHWRRQATSRVGMAGTAPNVVIVNAGSPTVYNMEANGSSGFSGSVSFTCSGVPSTATYSVTPNPLSIGNTSPVPFKVTINTTARTKSVRAIMGFSSFPWDTLAPASFLGLSILTMMVYMPTRRRWALATLLFCVTGLAACGGGGERKSTSSTSNQGTPAGNYAVVLTANSGTIIHAYDLVLTVK